MPGERRNLRSNSSTNDDRKPSAKGKAVPSKKANVNGSSNEGSREKPQINGTESNENGINGTEDVEMGDEEMTVVVPPAKGTKLNGDPGKDAQEDTSMEDGSGQDADNEGSCLPLPLLYACIPWVEWKPLMIVRLH